MIDGVLFTGVPSKTELENCSGMPSEERKFSGRVACVECVQEIPCNPCEGACPQKAIEVGAEITSLPKLFEEKCNGCGLCVAQCPGLSVFLVDKSYSKTHGTVDFPHEYLPLPEVGDMVSAVNRSGETVCRGKILEIKKAKIYDGTTVLRICVPLEFVDEVRGIKRLTVKD